jgi:flagellar basal-body rod protein FlgG
MSGVLEITELGMINDMQRLNVISNNLANVSTPGFKREIPVSRSFDATIANQLEAAGVNVNSATADVADMTSVVDQSTGSFKFTGNNFDIAIEGEGFFEVRSNNGVFYTRQGTLSMDAAGRLTTASGHILEGMGGDIRVTSNEPRIDKQGRIWENDTQVGQLKVVTFSDPRNLQKVGAGLYRAENMTGQALDDDAIRVRQGYLESSNVVMMNEMVQMMETMRHFETSQRLIKGYDELLDNAIRTLGDF